MQTSNDSSEQVNFFSALLENSNQGIVSCNTEGAITFINNKARDYLGFGTTPAKLWNDSYKLYGPDGIKIISLTENPFYRALQGEIVKDEEFMTTNHNDRKLNVQINAYPLNVNKKQVGAILNILDITESRTSSEKLNSRFKAIFEQSPFSIQICSKDGRTIKVNDAYKRLWSISDDFTDNFILKEYNILNDPLLEAAGQLDTIRKGFAGEVVQIPEFYYDPTKLGLPGRPRWASGLVYPLFDNQHRVVEVVIIHQDTTSELTSKTEKENLLAQLNIEKNRLAAIIQQIPAGIIVADMPDGKITLSNHLLPDSSFASYEVYRTDGSKYSLDEFPFMRALKEDKLVRDEEMFIKYKDGRENYINTRAAPIHDQDGNVAGSVAIWTDITEKIKVEKNQKFLAEIKSILLSTLDYNHIIGKIAAFSIPYLADGCMVDLIQGNDIKRIITKHSDPEIEMVMKELQQKFQPKFDSPQPSSRVIRSGNSEFLREVDIEVMKAHVLNAKHLELIKKINIRSHIAIPLKIRGKIIGAINLLVTQKNRRLFEEQDLEVAEEIGHHAALAIENARLYKDAQSAIQLRDDFISIASHELKTPITSLILQVQVMSSLLENIETEEGDIVKKAITNTNRQLERLTRLVEDMLDISRITTGKLTLNIIRMNLVEVTNEVLERFQTQLNQLGIQVNIKSENSIFVSADQYRIEQVITNLMTNAIRYGNRLPISIQISQESDKALFKMKDQGRGIAKHDKERIFNRFERAVDSDDVLGLGLGLFINRQIIEEHGGTICVESELNQGSTFTFELPLG